MAVGWIKGITRGHIHTYRMEGTLNLSWMPFLAMTYIHDPTLMRKLAILHVNLLQRLNVLADKADRHRQ